MVLLIPKLNKHDTYVDVLCTRLASQYDSLERNVRLYSKKKRVVAEIDILAKKGNVIDVYEVKCSYRKSKAEKQLKRIRKNLHKLREDIQGIDTYTYIRHAFFFCGASGNLYMMPRHET